MKQLYLDCDGVLADFDGGFEAQFGVTPRAYEASHGSRAFWRDIRTKAPRFYLFLPLLPDARALYEAVRHLKPTILTGCPGGGWAEAQKVAWAGVHFPDVPMITCAAREKRRYCRPGDVLVDDREKYRGLWEEAGGTFVLHRSAAASIPQVLAAFEDEPA